MRRSGRTDPATSAIKLAERPVETVFTRSADWTSDFFFGVFHSSQLVEENRKLREVARAASLYDSEVSQLRDQISDLQKLQNFPPEPGKQKIRAVVIAFFPDQAAATLDVGADQGLTPGLPVVAADGLLGVIQTVEKKTSQVTLIWSSSPAFKGIGGLVIENPPVAGLVRGDSPDKLRMELDPGALVKSGDEVVTTGWSDRIPRGIPIGRVVQVTDDKDFGLKRLQIYPSAQVTEVREVFVLK